MTAFDAVENGPVPRALIAATWNVYVVPAVSPVKVSVVTGELNVCCATWKKPTNAVMVYPVIADPLAVDGVVHDTVAFPAPAVAVTAVGAVGVPAITALLAPDAPPVPATFVAVTEHV